MIDCNDFLDRNIPALRDNELKRMNEIKDLNHKLKVIIKKNLEYFIENTENEYDNAASIDLFEEIQTMFESQLESLEIKNMDNYMETLKEKMSEIDFNDNLAVNARKSLAEYYEHNNLDDGFDFSGGDIENPFSSNIIKENESEFNNVDDKEIIAGKIGGIKDDEISSIIKNENNKFSDNNLNIFNFNYNTPNFNEEKEKKFNNNNNDSLNFINNFNSAFTIEETNKKINDNKNKIHDLNNNINDLVISRKFHQDSKKNIENLAGKTLCCLRGGNIDINNEIDSINIDQNDNIAEVNSDDSFLSSNENENLNDKDKDKSDDMQNNNNQLIEPIIKEKTNDMNSKEQFNNEKKAINKNFENNSISNQTLKNKNNNNIFQQSIKKAKTISKDNQTMNYGILGIIGLFCLKSLFSSNNIFSADFMLNLIILGIIGFTIYKSQFKSLNLNSPSKLSFKSLIAL
jgi:hypothetical protein